MDPAGDDLRGELEPGRAPQVTELPEPAEPRDPIEAAVQEIIASFPPACPNCQAVFRLREEGQGEYRAILEAVIRAQGGHV